MCLLKDVPRGTRRDFWHRPSRSSRGIPHYTGTLWPLSLSPFTGLSPLNAVIPVIRGLSLLCGADRSPNIGGLQ
jgi:hypothetical protein